MLFDVVGDGSSNIVGPFEAAQSQFIGGQVVPLVVGAFGDVNTDFENMLRTLAKLAKYTMNIILSERLIILIILLW